jgi:hypothetical protein
MKKKEKKVEELAPKEQAIEKIPENSGLNIENIISQAVKSKADVQVMKEMLAMRRELKEEFAKEAFDLAMATFQKECPVIEKTKIVKGKGGEIRYKYAPLESIVTQVKEILGKNGLSYSMNVSQSDGMLTVYCVAKHISGHSETSKFSVPIGNEQYMTDVQKYGARATFAKRYAFCNAFGILTGDEDTDAVEETVVTGTSKPVMPVNDQRTGGELKITNFQKNQINGLLEDLGWDEQSLVKRKIKLIDEMSIRYATGIIKQLQGLKAQIGEPKDEIKDADIVK